MANYRQIHTCIWKDAWFFELSADEKLLFIYLFSNERANLTGLYDLHERIIAFETGLDAKAIRAAFRHFSEAGKAYYEDGWVWVPNLIKYNAGSLDSDKIRTHIVGALSKTQDIPLKARCIDHYNGMVDPRYRIDTLCIPYPSELPEQEHEQEQDKEQEQENDPARLLYLEILDQWGSTFPEKTQPREDTTTNIDKVRSRMKRSDFREKWHEAMTRASRSEFCRSSGWFQLDWFIKNDSNWQKCLAGNYDNKRNGNGRQPEAGIARRSDGWQIPG